MKIFVGGSLLLLAAFVHGQDDDSGAIDVNVFYSSTCPYSQDFIPRHLVDLVASKLVERGAVHVHGFSDLRGFDYIDGECVLAKDAPSHAKLDACRPNVALACAEKEFETLQNPEESVVNKIFDIFETEDAVKSDQKLHHHVEIRIYDFIRCVLDWNQQLPFHKDRKGEPYLANCAADTVGEGFWKNHIRPCMQDNEQVKGLMIESQNEFESAERMLKSNKVDTEGKFPYLFIDDAFIPLDHGVFSVEDQSKDLVSYICKNDIVGNAIDDIDEDLCPAPEGNNIEKASSAKAGTNGGQEGKASGKGVQNKPRSPEEETKGKNPPESQSSSPGPEKSPEKAAPKSGSGKAPGVQEDPEKKGEKKGEKRGENKGEKNGSESAPPTQEAVENAGSEDENAGPQVSDSEEPDQGPGKDETTPALLM